MSTAMSHSARTRVSLNEETDRKKGIRRTALILAAIAVALYIGFILSGVLNA